MALNIDNYTHWASWQTAADKNVASLNRTGDGLVNINETTGTLARFFKTASFTRQRDAVRADFQRALTEHFGENVASTVMRGVGPNLTAAAIKSAVSEARLMIMRSALTPHGNHYFRVSDGKVHITRASINNMSDATRTALLQFKAASTAAADLLGSTPIGPTDLADAQQRTDRVRQELIDVKVALQLACADAPDDLNQFSLQRITSHCDALVRQLDDHLTHVNDLNTNGPLSQNSQDRFRDVWYDSMQLACAALKTQLLNNPEARTALDNLARTPKGQFDFVLSKDFKNILAARIDSALKEACGENPLPKKAASRALSKSFETILNQRPWTPISKVFTGSQAGAMFQLTSTITPGKHVAGVGETYPRGVNGYMCHSATESDHAVNLAISSLRVKSSPFSDRLAFTGVRHGVHCAWELNDDNQRAQANRNRATEAVKAAFSAYLSAHPNVQPGQEIRLPMTSVSLLTPESFRPILAKFTGNHSSDERMMLREQTAAWNSLNGQPLQVTINGHNYTVRPEIATFNFGVNQGGVGKLSGIIGGWDVSENMNNSALMVLYRRTQAFVSDGNQPSDKRLLAERLFHQIRIILNTKQERSDVHDAYKAASRIAVLTSLMDGVPCWNCKSGKDRTGEMDVECKFLATLISRNLDIPEPGAPLTDEQKTLFRTIALESGNHEMQEYNTGIAGYKTGGVDSIPERLGGSEARAFHKGGAQFVGV